MDLDNQDKPIHIYNFQYKMIGNLRNWFRMVYIELVLFYLDLRVFYLYLVSFKVIQVLIHPLAISKLLKISLFVYFSFRFRSMYYQV